MSPQILRRISGDSKTKISLLIKTIFLSFILLTISVCSSGDIITTGFVWYEIELNLNIFEFNYNVESNIIIIRGESLDGATYDPLIGASISIFEEENDTAKSHTDIDGYFDLQFKYNANQQIEFSYIGYKAQTYKLKAFVQKYFEY